MLILLLGLIKIYSKVSWFIVKLTFFMVFWPFILLWKIFFPSDRKIKTYPRKYKPKKDDLSWINEFEYYDAIFDDSEY